MKLGLIEANRWTRFEQKLEDIARAGTLLHDSRIEQLPGDVWLRRPEYTWEDVIVRVPELGSVSMECGRQVEYDIKYAGYVARQLIEVDRNRRLAGRRIPDDFDYSKIVSLRTEARQKLTAIRPVSLEQAGRISGITPADLAVLIARLESPSSTQPH